jgi:hypothetical protein
MTYSNFSKEMQLLVKRLNELGVVSPENLIGCSPAEIERIKETCKSHLPSSYLEFLTIMGRGAGRYFRGTDMYFPVIIKLQEWAIEIVAENPNKFQLPNDAFVFSMHQGYQFMYFRTNGGDDPKVYYYMEGRDQAECITDSFSAYLLQSALDEW